MCQCIIADCWWCNCCGICCAGWLYALCCVSCWLCKPLELINEECCHIGFCAGYGGNLCCYGSVCCAPEYLIQYSNIKSTGATGQVVVKDRQAMLGGQQTIY